MRKTRKLRNKKQTAGRIVISDDKIRNFIDTGLTSNTYEKNPKYHKEILEFILKNSTITKLTYQEPEESLYGIIYKVTLKDGVLSPLINLHINESLPDHGNFGKTVCSANTFFRNKCFKDIRTFLLKLSFISIEAETLITQSKSTITMIKFNQEAKIQNDCYNKTYELGESVVPACISPPYIDLIKNKGAVNPLFEILLREDIDTDGYLSTLAKLCADKKVLQFGLILMEFAEGFKTLYEIVHDKEIPEDNKYKATILAKAAHLSLYNEGFIQGDCHNQNVMVNLNYEGFLSGTKGKALIIDFGRAIKHDGMVSLLPVNYTAIFEYINLISNDSHQMHHPPYEWIKILNGRESSDISEIIKLRSLRFNKLTTKIADSATNIVKKDALFIEFLKNLNIKSFNDLRWKNVNSAFNLKHIAPLPKVVVTPNAVPLPKVVVTPNAVPLPKAPVPKAPVPKAAAKSVSPQKNSPYAATAKTYAKMKGLGEK